MFVDGLLAIKSRDIDNTVEINGCLRMNETWSLPIWGLARQREKSRTIPGELGPGEYYG